MYYYVLADQILEPLIPGLDIEIHSDVWCIICGKLRDRPPRVYDAIGVDRVKGIVSYSIKTLLKDLSLAELASLAKSYRVKYTDLVGERVTLL